MTNLKRYNVFNNIHKGLRGMLFSTQIKWQQTDFTLPEAKGIVTDLEKVLHIYDEHANHEDKFILANIIEKEPQVAGALEEDHVTDHQLSDKLRELLSQWKEAEHGRRQGSLCCRLFFMH